MALRLTTKPPSKAFPSIYEGYINAIAKKRDVVGSIASQLQQQLISVNSFAQFDVASFAKTDEVYKDLVSANEKKLEEARQAHLRRMRTSKEKLKSARQSADLAARMGGPLML